MIKTVIIAFTGYTLLNIGQAGQKMGLGIRNDNCIAGVSIWTISTLATVISFPVVFYAIATGYVSVVGAMAGSGLLSLALFGRFVMCE